MTQTSQLRSLLLLICSALVTTTTFVVVILIISSPSKSKSFSQKEQDQNEEQIHQKENQEQEQEEMLRGTTRRTRLLSPRLPSNVSDPYNLMRFVEKQKEWHEIALQELQGGRKQSHYSWWIFPVPPFVAPQTGMEGGSSINRHFALRDAPGALSGDKAAKAYLKFPTVDGVNLRRNYIEIFTTIKEQLDVTSYVPVTMRAIYLLGHLDVPKVQSSLRLFEEVSRDNFDEEINLLCLDTLGVMKSHTNL